MRGMLSQLVREDRLVVVDSLSLDQAKTRDLVAKLKGMGLDHVLILVDQYDEKLCLAARNIPWADVLAAREINPLSLIRFEKVLATAAAVRTIEERLS